MTQSPHSNECDLSPGAELSDADGQLAGTARLLVSIRDVTEAAMALACGVDWIDLKEPGSGALGRAELAVAEAVAAQLSPHPLRSAALGELTDLPISLPISVTAQFAELFPFLKVGLSGTANTWQDPGGWQHQLLELANDLKTRGAELIPVIYADFTTCDAPSPAEIIAFVEQAHSKYLLIDTFTKDGRRLTDWLDQTALAAIKASAAAFGCVVVFAGSLRQADIEVLRPLEPYAFAVRGAVCSGSRGESISARKVAELCKFVHGRGELLGESGTT